MAVSGAQPAKMLVQALRQVGRRLTVLSFKPAGERGWVARQVTMLRRRVRPAMANGNRF